MDIVINLQPLMEFFSLPADVILLKLFLMVGWIPVAITFIWGVAQVWLRYIRLKFGVAQKQVLLAINIPRGNMQSPKAVENIFSYLAAMHSTYDYYETWWLGESQPNLSLEIVSIEGHIQYLVRIPVKYKEILETSVYSQYPDAEITEVYDYTSVCPDKFPDEQYDIWGCEYILTKSNALPVKTYINFESTFGKPEVIYKDTNAALMDLMSSLNKGEQIWYQLILIPIHPDYWSKEASPTSEEVISEIVGEKIEPKKNIVDKIGDSLIKFLGDFSEVVYKLWGDIEDKKEEKEEQPFKMMNLKPRQKKQIEAVQEKVGKLSFGVKIRFLYLAKKEVMNKYKAANGFGGFMKQFQTSDLNSFKANTGAKGTATKVNYPIFKQVRLNRKKRKIVMAYKNRSDTIGRTPMVLNIEELATIWHFPIDTVVKAPLIQTAAGRKVEPPSSLPFSKDNVDLSIFKGKSKINDSDNIFFKQAELQVESQDELVGKNNNDAKDSSPGNLPFA